MTENSSVSVTLSLDCLLRVTPARISLLISAKKNLVWTFRLTPASNALSVRHTWVREWVFFLVMVDFVGSGLSLWIHCVYITLGWVVGFLASWYWIGPAVAVTLHKKQWAVGVLNGYYSFDSRTFTNFRNLQVNLTTVLSILTLVCLRVVSSVNVFLLLPGGKRHYVEHSVSQRHKHFGTTM